MRREERRFFAAVSYTHLDVYKRQTDEHLGVGGPKAKFQANVNAIRLLKELEAAGQQASPEQQEVLSRYVGLSLIHI